MRWIVQKDLRILRRSPLVVAVLVLYPLLVSVLIGLALSGGPQKPRVAIVNELAGEDTTFGLGGREIDPAAYARRLYEVVDPVPASTRDEALELVREGKALGALVVPAEVVQRLERLAALGGGQPPQVEVIYSTEDPVQARIVEGLISSRLALANQALAEELVKASGDYLRILARGGSFELLGQRFDVLGLQRTVEVLQGVLRVLPEGVPGRADLESVVRFARLAVDNLDLSDQVLGAIGTPIEVKRTRVGGDAAPLEDFAVAVAVVLSLCLVAVLLGAGLLALEREEGAFGRLVRGLVSPARLLAAKALLGALCATAATAIMLAVLVPFADLDATRAPLWLLALLAGGVGFAALGVALGALAREVRAASLLAVLLILPIAALALVPDGAAGGVVAAAIDGVSAVFPFDPALRALDAALNATGGLGAAAAHAAGLAVAYLVLARAALARFGS